MSNLISDLAGARLPPVEDRWDEDDAILYHLAVGATTLDRTYEASLSVLPSFVATRAMAVIPALDAVLEMDRARVLHGGQTVNVQGALPARAVVEHRGRIAAVHDKGSAALVQLDVDTVDADATLLASSRFDIFLRGAGGFGGERGASMRFALPDREPDEVIDSPTLPQQAMLFRLTGDKNPLHVDPAFARASGFERPILHGLCTYGIACLAAAPPTAV